MSLAHRLTLEFIEAIIFLCLRRGSAAHNLESHITEQPWFCTNFSPNLLSWYYIRNFLKRLKKSVVNILNCPCGFCSIFERNPIWKEPFNSKVKGLCVRDRDLKELCRASRSVGTIKIGILIVYFESNDLHERWPCCLLLKRDEARTN